MVEAGEKDISEDGDHDGLPEGEEECDFDGEEFEQRRIRSQRLVQGMIEQNEVVQRVGGR